MAAFLTAPPGSPIIPRDPDHSVLGGREVRMSRRKRSTNNVRALREELLLSKAELARRAEVSPLTIDRVEGGADCRLDTKRKIILALGKRLAEREEVFPDLARDEAELQDAEAPQAHAGASAHEDE